MRTRTKAAIFAGGLCLAYSLGTLNNPTETRIVKVPQVKTLVETKTETLTVHKELPTSCLEAMDALGKIANADSSISEAAGSLLDAMTDVERDSVMRDFKSMNKTLASIRGSKQQLDTSVTSDADARNALEIQFRVCESDLKGE